MIVIMKTKIALFSERHFKKLKTTQIIDLGGLYLVMQEPGMDK